MAKPQKLTAVPRVPVSSSTKGTRPQVTTTTTNTSKSGKENTHSQVQIRSTLATKGNSKAAVKNSQPLQTHAPSSHGAKDAEMQALLARVVAQQGK